MHVSAYMFATQFYNTFCAFLPESAVVVDFGSYDVNGTLKPLFTKHKYIGIDMSEGPNVDIVCENSKTPLENDSVDVIVSSSCFEHDEFFWETFLEMCRILKEGGVIYINAPSSGDYHGYPGDCWRFYKDSWSALAKWANKHGHAIELVYSHVEPTGHFKDSMGVFKKLTTNFTIESEYLRQCQLTSDINEHLPILYQYASDCLTITECGVRTAVSSYAFANAIKTKPNARLVQVDLKHHTNIGVFQKICSKETLSTIFYGMSDLKCPLEETDLLFIDTWHIYGQLKRELARWHTYVNKYIIMHDTTVDGIHGETLRNGWDFNKQSRESGIPVDEICKGLRPAIQEFLNDHPEWVIDAEYPNNNGLTILKRCSISSIIENV